MNTRSALALLAALLPLLAYSAAGQPFDVRAFVWTRLTVANNSTQPYPLPPLSIELPANDTYQSSRLVNATVRVAGAPVPCSLRVVEGECGSPYLWVSCSARLPPRGTAEVEVVSEVLVRRFKAPPLNVTASGTLRDIPRGLTEFTRPEGPWAYDSWRARYLVEAARRVAGGEDRVLAVVAKLVEWIWGKVDYEVGPGPRYPWETLPPDRLEEGRGKGDCDDQANLLILMLRSLGVPAYLKTALVADFNYREERRIWSPEAHYYAAFAGIDYAHAWAEVYVPPWGWLPVDLTFHAATGDPLDAIRTSAPSDYWIWWTIVTVRMESVCHADYIREFREWAAQAAATPLFYYWEYAVVQEGDSIARVKGFLEPLPLPWVKPTEISVEYPSRAKALEEVSIKGVLKPGVANATVLVKVRKPSGAELLLEARTGPGGEWAVQLVPDEAGVWTFNATYPGSADYAPSSRDFTIYVEKLPSSLSLRARQVDSRIEVEGRLEPPVNASLTLIAKLPSGRTERLEILTVNGAFNWSLPAGEPGKYSISAFWVGSSVYEAAYSSAEVWVELPTQLSVTAERVNGRVVVKGLLSPPVPNATVIIRASSGARTVEAEAKVNASGAFRAELELEPGEWEIAARFEGGGGYRASSAATRITLTRPLGVELGAVAVLAAAAALVALAVKRRAGRR